MSIDADNLAVISKILGVPWQTDETTSWSSIEIKDECGQLQFLVNSRSGVVNVQYTTNSFLRFGFGLSFAQFELKYLDALASRPVLLFFRIRKDGLKDQLEIYLMGDCKITNVRFLSGVDSSKTYQI